jgi:hypothetical protein
MQQVSVVDVQLHNPSSQKLCQTPHPPTLKKRNFLYVFMAFLLLLEMGYAILVEAWGLHADCLQRSVEKRSQFNVTEKLSQEALSE